MRKDHSCSEIHHSFRCVLELLRPCGWVPLLAYERKRRREIDDEHYKIMRERGRSILILNKIEKDQSEIPTFVFLLFPVIFSNNHSLKDDAHEFVFICTFLPTSVSKFPTMSNRYEAYHHWSSVLEIDSWKDPLRSKPCCSVYRNGCFSSASDVPNSSFQVKTRMKKILEEIFYQHNVSKKTKFYLDKFSFGKIAKMLGEFHCKIKLRELKRDIY